MKIRKKAEEIAGGLEPHGLVFRSFTVESEGEWSAEDADWNYKDVPHLNIVHSLAETVPGAVGDEFIATVNIQKILGVPVPIALANYVASDGTQVYFTTLLCFVLVVETRIIEPEDRAEVWASVKTTYRVGGPRLAMLLFPLIRRMLRANYQVLMSEDLPMRDQRGRLRKLGYSFRSDGRPRTFAETTELWTANVVEPEYPVAESMTVELSALEAPGASVSVGGQADGLRFVRSVGSQVLVFDRVCSHEGADLGVATIAGECLVCPWHAKRVRPVAVFDLDDRSVRSFEAGARRVVTVEGEALSVSARP